MSMPSWRDRYRPALSCFMAVPSSRRRALSHDRRSSPAMSVPSLAVTADGLLLCFSNSPAMSMPSWRDRHLACCDIKKDY
jgi:hypothetical protein